MFQIFNQEIHGSEQMCIENKHAQHQEELRQEDCLEHEASLSYLTSTAPKKMIQ